MSFAVEKMVGGTFRATSNLARAQDTGRDQSSVVDRFLLVAALVLLPLQEQFSIFAGRGSSFSFMWIIFALMGLYVSVMQPHSLLKAAMHPVFLAAYALLIVGCVVENFHADPDYGDLKSYAYMIGGGVVIAALCRDRKSLKAVFFGYIGASLWLGIFLILNFYGQFQGTVATNLDEATTVRDQIFSHNSLATGLNTIAAIMAQGTVLALTLTLTDKSSRRRILWLFITLFLVVASFLPMSRGAVLMIVLSCVLVMIAFRGKRLRALLAAGVLAATVAIWVPSVVFTRLTSSANTSYYSSLVAPADRKVADGRSRVYAAALQSLPEYWAFGVGDGNYWKSWAFSHKLGDRRRGASGAHNCFLQITIYWGLPGLLALLGVLICALRCLPKRCGRDPLSLGLLGLAFALLVWMLQMHDLYDKEFSLGLGLLVGARIWIWPKGVVAKEPRSRKRADAVSSTLRLKPNSGFVSRLSFPSVPASTAPSGTNFGRHYPK